MLSFFDLYSLNIHYLLKYYYLNSFPQNSFKAQNSMTFIAVEEIEVNQLWVEV